MGSVDEELPVAPEESLEPREESTFDRWSRMAETASSVDPSWYCEYDVKRGLRDVSGKGVLAGLTQIGDVIGSVPEEDMLVPAPGQLSYRGYDLEELVGGFASEDRLGFEETCYLLLFGELPDEDELRAFRDELAAHRMVPSRFVNDSLLRLPSRDTMNAMARVVLAMYVLDRNADDTSIRNVLWQSLLLISVFPVLAVYAYKAYRHHYQDRSLVIHSPSEELSTAENILHMLRPDCQYTELEAKVLDLSLVLHAEHGGGNNSSFTTHVVSSTGTDTYAAIAASLCSLKGPRHGGANIKVNRMFAELTEEVGDWENDDEIAAYLRRIVDKEAFDNSGLIYGIGHPVYSISDPRTVVLRRYAEMLAEEKDLMEEFLLRKRVEELAPQVIGERRKVYKGVCANVDYYSGFVYRMLGIPVGLYTPLFAVSRVVGWCAHRLEELSSGGKIVRPAYKSVVSPREYVPLSER
jgi:citrate synthase